eukprot:Partr_v1_DN21524_c0_g1_i1_m20329 putative translocase of inner mitochondrial membrane 21 homolog (yeast)
MIRNLTRVFPRRFYSPSPNVQPDKKALVSNNSKRYTRYQSDVITMDTAKKWRDMTSGERVVYATKQTSYTGIVLAGLGLSATLIYLVTSELFGSDHASAMYNKALDSVRANEQAVALLGEPVKGYRDHQRLRTHKLRVYEDDKTGKKTAFMKFGISGSVNEGTVKMWLEQDSHGHWQYQHLNVEIPGGGRPSRRVVIADNRVQ